MERRARSEGYVEKSTQRRVQKSIICCLNALQTVGHKDRNTFIEKFRNFSMVCRSRHSIDIKAKSI